MNDCVVKNLFFYRKEDGIFDVKATFEEDGITHEINFPAFIMKQVSEVVEAEMLLARRAVVERFAKNGEEKI